MAVHVLTRAPIKFEVASGGTTHAPMVMASVVIEVRQSVLDERDGPMLKHGLQGMHRQRIVLPRAQQLQPDPMRLEERYEAFRSLL